MPADTGRLPFELWLNGWLRGSAVIGDVVEIETVTGRLIQGVFVEERPGYRHSFGSPPLALKRAGDVAVASVRATEAAPC